MSAAAVLMMQGGMPVLAPPGDLPVAQPADMAALAERLAAAEASIAALKARPATVFLAAALPVATVQAGTFVFKVACKGLLPADRVGVQPAAGAAVPSGLVLGWARPEAADTLAVSVGALSVVLVKAAVLLDVVAFRAPPAL